MVDASEETFFKEDTQMDNKYMKRWSPSLIITKMQIKTTLKYHSHPSEWLLSKKYKKWGHVGQDGEKREPLNTVRNANWFSHHGKEYGESQNIKNETPIWASSSTSGYLSEECKTLIWKDTCSSMFIAVLFTIAKIWKKFHVHRWMNRYKGTVLICVMEYYLAIKRIKILPFYTMSMQLDIMLDEISQRKKNIVWFILYVESTKTKTNKQTKVRQQAHGYRAECWLQKRGVEVRDMGEDKQTSKIKQKCLISKGYIKYLAFTQKNMKYS